MITGWELVKLEVKWGWLKKTNEKKIFKNVASGAKISKIWLLAPGQKRKGNCGYPKPLLFRTLTTDF